MTAHRPIEKPHQTQSLDQSLFEFLTEIMPARVGAMQVLMYHAETRLGQDSAIPLDDLTQAFADVKRALAAMMDLQPKRLDPLGIVLPDDMRVMAEQLTSDLAKLDAITAHCEIAEDGNVQGFFPSDDMYDVCCTRVAKGISAFSGVTGTFFLTLTSKENAQVLQKTSEIAMEIGKIGRAINMVATNASIEAARAGDAGKGFTVIADEVKVLSSRVSSLSVSLTDRIA